MDRPKTILITGASGHLGLMLVQLAVNRGMAVKATYNTHRPTFEHPQVLWCKSALNKPDLEPLFQDVDVLVHCAGKISIHGDQDGSVRHTNVEGTRAVAELCAALRVKMLHISSTHAVQELPSNEPFDESRPYKTEQDAAYDYSKAEGERVVSNLVEGNGLDAIIFRPSSMVGPPDIRPSLLGDAMRQMYLGKLPAVTTGGYDMVDVRDVAETVLNGIDHHEPGAIFNLTGKYYPIAHLALCLNNLGGKKPPMKIPIPALLVLAPLVNAISKVQGASAPFTRESLLTLKNAHKEMSHQSAKRKLAHNPRPLEESLSDLVSWWKQHNMV